MEKENFEDQRTVGRFSTKLTSQEGQVRTRIIGVTFILATTLFLSNVLGMLRDRLLVTKFTTTALDTYFAAFRLPDLIYNLLILGALATVFVPVFTGYIAQKKKEDAFLLANSIINLGFLILIPACLVMIFFAPFFVKILAPGFDSERFQTTVVLTRLLLITPIIFGLSGIFGAILNSFKEFVLYSLSPIVYNLGIIGGILFLTPFWGIYGIAVGVIAGAFLHFLIPFLVSFRFGYHYKAIIDFTHAGVKIIGKMMSLRILNLATTQLVWYFYIFIGSFLQAGSIAIVNFANHIQTLPLVVFSTSFSTAISPYISEKASLNKKEKLLSDINWTIRQILFLIIPSMVGIILLRAQIIRLVLGSQIFTWQDTRLAAASLLVFILSLPAQASFLPLSRIFYAILDAKTPTKIGIFSSFLNIVLAFILVNHFFVPYYQKFLEIGGDIRIIGLPLAFSLATIVNTLLLFYFLQKKVGALDFSEILNSFSKTSFASLVMGVFVYFTLHFIAPLVNMETFLGILLQTLCGVGVGLIVFFYITYFLKMEEFQLVKNFFKKPTLIKKR